MLLFPLEHCHAVHRSVIRLLRPWKNRWQSVHETIHDTCIRLGSDRTFPKACLLRLSKVISGRLSVKASPEPPDGTRHEAMNMHIIGFITRIVIWTIVLLPVPDNLNGTVKYVGLKTTRLTSISGEELVISNTDLLKSRIHNFRKMQERRMVFTIGVTFDTPPEKLMKIGGVVPGHLQPHSRCPTRSHPLQQYRPIQSGLRNRMLRQGFQLYDRHGRATGNQLFPDRTFRKRKHRIRFPDTDSLHYPWRNGISRHAGCCTDPGARQPAVTGYKDGVDDGICRPNPPFRRLHHDA